MLGHYKVCVKAFKSLNSRELAHEANVLSKLTHQNLPYLFGICLGDCPSIVTSYHGFNNCSVTIHSALFKRSKDLDCFVDSVNWKDILRQISCGLEHLHLKIKLLHNDIKCDNVVLTSRDAEPSIGVVIIDFGKACDIGKGRSYSLSQSQKDYYKKHHPHIAPDLRDGLCKQSERSDICYHLSVIHKLLNCHKSVCITVVNFDHVLQVLKNHLNNNITFILLRKCQAQGIL